jgi:curved DNA-binding protein CbpA
MIGRKDTTNYYEVLEVRQDSAQTEVYRAYQRAKATYSPENPALYSMFTAEESRELLKVIEEAYSVLSNAALRKNYDDNLLSNRNGIEKNIANFIQAENAAAITTSEPMKSNYSQNTKTETVEPTKFQTVEATEDYVVRRKDPGSQLPEGYGKTSLSTYKIDKSKEDEFSKVEHMDGSFLKSVREYKNLTIERVSDATRISRTYLNAVEANDYRELPAPVFVRGFIVQMARLLNLDENRVANAYLTIYKSNKK